MKYKLGDKVRIKSIDWYNANKSIIGCINHQDSYAFINQMSKYCGEIATIKLIYNDNDIKLDIDNGDWCWSDFMFDENFKNMETKKIILPEGWEIDKVENGEIILKESKKELPKTWEECYIKLGMGEYISNLSEIIENIDLVKSYKSNKNMLPVGLGKPIIALIQLLICREVYRQGWKPDWNNNENKYCIKYYNTTNIICTIRTYCSCILSFQSEKIRNQFLENFYDLIEEAKELL